MSALPEPDEDGVIRTTATIAGQTYPAKIHLQARIVSIETGPAITNRLAELITQHHAITVKTWAGVPSKAATVAATPAHAAMNVMAELTAIAVLHGVSISTSGVTATDTTDLDEVIGDVEKVLRDGWIADRMYAPIDPATK